MNKLLTKIATAFVGMAMAIGVGVAISDKKDVSPAFAAIPSTSEEAFEVTFKKEYITFWEA